jgi:flagellar basal-body rod modification protein FlgD
MTPNEILSGPPRILKELASSTTPETDTTLSDATGQTEESGEEFNTFLRLLTAQIKNQDPLAPLDSTQFVEQLATFTNLEMQAKSNQTLEEIAFLLSQQVESS